MCDTGKIVCGGGGGFFGGGKPTGSMAVDDVKVAAGFVLHTSAAGVEGVVKVGDSCEALVDYERRGNIMPNHTLTQVLNYALRTVLGDGVGPEGFPRG